MKILVSFIGLSLFLMVSCTETTEKEESCKKPEKEMIDHVPSELAVLMDKMYKTADSVKNSLVQKDSLAIFSLNQETLLTAKSVNERVETPEYTAYAKAYLNLLNAFNESREDRIMKFNSLVDGCMNCHEQICHGPTARIKKLYIK